MAIIINMRSQQKNVLIVVHTKNERIKSNMIFI